MKSIHVLLILLVWGQAYADSGRLAPVVDHSSSRTGYAGKAQQSPQGNNLYAILGRLEQLQLEVQQLRGIVEEQSYKIEQLQQRQQIADPLRSVEAPSVPGIDNTDSLDQQAQAEGSPGYDQQAAPPKQRRPLTAAQLQAEKQAYQRAYETLRSGHNNKAINLFKQLQADYPHGEYADNGQYWLAEAYKVNQEIELARVTFENLISQYPASSKVPDAKLKLGYIEFERNNLAKARQILNEITTRYPGTTVAHLATKKLEQLNNY